MSTCGSSCQATAVAFLALFTRFFDCSMRRDTAVTGFFSLTGDINAIAGVNSKIRVAKSAGYKRVVIPQLNLIDVCEELKNDTSIEIVPVLSAFQLLNACLDDQYSECRLIITTEAVVASEYGLRIYRGVYTMSITGTLTSALAGIILLLMAQCLESHHMYVYWIMQSFPSRQDGA